MNKTVKFYVTNFHLPKHQSCSTMKHAIRSKCCSAFFFLELFQYALGQKKSECSYRYTKCAQAVTCTEVNWHRKACIYKALILQREAAVWSLFTGNGSFSKISLIGKSGIVEERICWPGLRHILSKLIL